MKIYAQISFFKAWPVKPLLVAGFLRRNYSSVANFTMAAEHYRAGIAAEHDGSENKAQTAINRGFGLLATSRWTFRYEAKQAFDLARELENGEKYSKAIKCGLKKIDNVQPNASEADPAIKEDDCFHFIDDEGNDHEFHDKTLGFEEPKNLMSFVCIP